MRSEAPVVRPGRAAWLAALAAVAVVILALSGLEAAPPPSLSYVANQVIVLARDAAAVEALHGRGYVTVKVDPFTSFRLMTLPPARTMANELAHLANRGDIIAAQPNYIVRSLRTPNDPLFSSQYHHAIARCTEAWDIATGSSSETIAILDSGIDTTHPDLAARLVLVSGCDLLDGDADPSEAATGTGHATMVAGMAAAITDNATLVSGVDWNARVMPIRFLTESDGGSAFNSGLGLMLATGNEATTINCSYGATNSSILEEMGLLYALNSRIPVIAAAGNDGEEDWYYVGYPAWSRHSIAVGATNSSDNRASFSSYGVPPDDVGFESTLGIDLRPMAGVDIVAPGENILTLKTGGGTTTVNGTSFAAPFVAGAVSILSSMRPEYTPANIRALLIATAKDLGAAGYDDGTGHGRVDVYNLLNSARTATLYPFANDTAGIRVDSFAHDPVGDIRTAVTATGGRRGRRRLPVTGDNVYVGYAGSLGATSGGIEFYYRHAGAQSAETGYIVTQKGAAAKSSGHLDLVLTADSRLQYSLHDSGSVVSSTRLESGQWYHVAMTWGAKGMILYVNGDSEASRAVAGGPPIGDTLYLGVPAVLGGAAARGSFDSLRFSDTQRTIFPAALRANIEGQMSRAFDAGLVLWTALQNDTTDVRIAVYADKDTVGYDGVLLAADLPNYGFASLDLSSLESLGDTYYFYIVATDSTYNEEMARAYAGTWFQAFSPIISLISATPAASENFCVLDRIAPGFRDAFVPMRRARDLCLQTTFGRLLVAAYYRIGSWL